MHVQFLTLGLISVFAVSSSVAKEAETKFFERRIRPLLAKRCFACHSADAEAPESGLRLDHREGLIRGGASGPAIVPGAPRKSLLIQAVRYEKNEMPPDGKLSAVEIRRLEKWVGMGAPWPDSSAAVKVLSEAGYDWEHYRTRHWSFRPVKKSKLPEVKDVVWPQGEIDRFILSGLEQKGLRPSAPVEAHILIRRIYLDLIGIPPKPEEVGVFVAEAAVDRSAAVSRLVNRLLDSPLYGERWGRHWLDVARFSDGSGGFLDNKTNSEAWRYRDWVVDAFNTDMPWNEFLRLQIAGDLLGDKQAAIGTGFFALGPQYKSDGGDPDSIAQAKSETLDDRIDTLTRGILGLTVSCARCHDHKFDPIPQQDYYSLAGIFENSSVRELPLVESAVVNEWNVQQQAIQVCQKKIDSLRKAVRKENRDLTDDEQSRIDQWNRELADLKAAARPKYPLAHSLHDTGQRDMRIAIRGNLRQPGEMAPRRFLRILGGNKRPKFTNGSGRVELANAIADPVNPLTARVIANRIWQHHFGKALVRTPSNLGVLGETPTHPALLDWLAATFVESGWSVKTLHRRIMTSAVWQQSSQMDTACFSVDSDNRLVWRMNPRRVDVEVWRDSLLATTGELDLQQGGPPVDDLAGSRRRTLYARVSRNGDQFASDDFLRLFDFPIMRATVAKRPASIVPQQYLFMLNSRFMVMRSQAFAVRLKQETATDADTIQTAYRLLFGRLPTDMEQRISAEFLANRSSADDSESPLSPLVQYAQVLLSSNEFMYVR